MQEGTGAERKTNKYIQTARNQNIEPFTQGRDDLQLPLGV